MNNNISFTIQVNSDIIHEGDLILVNEKYPLKQSEKKIEKTLVRDGKILLNNVCYNNLINLIESCNASKEIILVSGYRKKQEQIELYNESLCKNGIEFTKNFVAIPDCSEHQTGLAIDVGLNKENIDYIRPYFPSIGKCLEFKNNAYNYGFINRYKNEKKHITNIVEEPWHYRYVGYPHSIIIDKYKFCLEEYIEYIKNYTFNRPYVFYHNINLSYIYYVKADNMVTTLSIIQGEKYKISGNNVDGFIVTIFKSVEEYYD